MPNEPVETIPTDDPQRPPEPGGALCLSGGGYRAMVFHVGALWRLYEAGLLASAYRSSLTLAAAHGLASVAFPSISTGAYRYPLEAAARIALGEVRRHLAGEQGATSVRQVRFVLFDVRSLEVYEAAARELFAAASPG